MLRGSLDIEQFGYDVLGPPIRLPSPEGLVERTDLRILRIIPAEGVIFGLIFSDADWEAFLANIQSKGKLVVASSMPRINGAGPPS